MILSSRTLFGSTRYTLTGRYARSAFRSRLLLRYRRLTVRKEGLSSVDAYRVKPVFGRRQETCLCWIAVPNTPKTGGEPNSRCWASLGLVPPQLRRKTPQIYQL